MKTKEQKSGAMLLIALGWLMYTTSYLGKVNYSANITQIIDFYNISKSEAGIPPTFFFFAYGIGQVFNGIFCKKYNIKYMIFASMLISALINLFIAVSSDFSLVKWLWLLNGFVLSVLWPSLVRLMSESLPKNDLGKSSVVLGTTVACGTLVIYGLSSVFAIFDKFKFAFYTAAIAGTAVGIIWLILYDKAVEKAKSQRNEDDFVRKVDINEPAKKEKFEGREKKIFIISVCVLCFCAIGVNLMKDGLTTWVPSILKDEFSLTDSLSILITLFLPIVAVFGNAGALKMHKKIPDYIVHCFVVFVLIALLTGFIILNLTLKNAVLMLVGLVMVNFFASSLNSLITSIYPMFMREKVNSGLFAGVLNGFCYLGSTMSSYGLGLIAEKFDWMMVFWFLIAFSVLVCIVSAIYMVIKRALNKRA